MLVFTNHYSAIIFALAVVLVIGGLVRFVAQVVRWDSEYENFLLFPLRLAIYAVPYLFVPCLGIVIGGVMIRSKTRVKRKFANASIYMSIIGLLLWISSFGAAIQ